jgi:cation transport ATPase
MVESAQMNKAPVQAYADRIAGVFTPLVLALAVVTFLSWAALAWMHRYSGDSLTVCREDHACILLNVAICIILFSISL